MGGRRGIRTLNLVALDHAPLPIGPSVQVVITFEHEVTRARGAASRIRTSDLPIRSRVLSPLSQRRKEARAEDEPRDGSRLAEAIRPVDPRACASIRRCRRNGHGGPRGPKWLYCPAEGLLLAQLASSGCATKAQRDHAKAQTQPTAEHELAAASHGPSLIVRDHGPLDMRHRERCVKREDAAKSSPHSLAAPRDRSATYRDRCSFERARKPLAKPSRPQRSRVCLARCAQFSRLGAPGHA